MVPSFFPLTDELRPLPVQVKTKLKLTGIAEIYFSAVRGTFGWGGEVLSG